MSDLEQKKREIKVILHRYAKGIGVPLGEERSEIMSSLLVKLDLGRLKRTMATMMQEYDPGPYNPKMCQVGQIMSNYNRANPQEVKKAEPLPVDSECFIPDSDWLKQNAQKLMDSGELTYKQAEKSMEALLPVAVTAARRLKSNDGLPDDNSNGDDGSDWWDVERSG